MENENIERLNENNKLNSQNIFKLDYKGQSLKGNIKFEEWKKEMLNIYGNDAKLFKCKRDYIYFYCSNQDCKTLPFYESVCPICHYRICYFCSKCSKYDYTHGECCIIRRIYCMIFQDGFTYINGSADEEYNFKENIIFLCPIIGFMYFAALFSIAFFYKLKVKDKNVNEEYYGIYEDEIKDSENNFCKFETIVGLNIGLTFVLSFTFLILDIYFKILFILISLIFKGYPFKFYFGILYEGLRGSL